MCFHIELFIKNYAEIFNRSTEWYGMPINLDMNQIRNSRISTWGTHQNNLGFIPIQLEFICHHPRLDLFNAFLDPFERISPFTRRE